MSKKDSRLRVVAHKLRFLLHEDEVVTITNISMDGAIILEGYLGEQHFTFPVRNRDELMQVLGAEKELPVVTDIPKEDRDEPVKLIPVEIPVKKPEVKPVTPTFFPPNVRLEVTRQKFSSKDPREQALMSRFIMSYPNPYKGRKKLTDDEKVYVGTREDAIEIAKSYILSGDRATVERWIEHNQITLNK